MLLLSNNAVSPEPIHTVFSIATSLSQPFFVLMIIFPQAKITKQQLMGTSFGRLATFANSVKSIRERISMYTIEVVRFCELSFEWGSEQILLFSEILSLSGFTFYAREETGNA